MLRQTNVPFEYHSCCHVVGPGIKHHTENSLSSTNCIAFVGNYGIVADVFVGNISGLLFSTPTLIVSHCCVFQLHTIHRCNSMNTINKIKQPNTSIIYNKPTRCNSGSIVFIKNYKYALHQRFSNCGPRTTGGPRVLPLWSFYIEH